MRAEPVLVIERGGSGPDHLHAGRLGAPVNEILVQPGFDFPDIVQPIVQGQILVDAAQQDHGCVGVHVHETGDDGFPAAVHRLGAGRRLRYGADVLDAAPVDEDVGPGVSVKDVFQENHVLYCKV